MAFVAGAPAWPGACRSTGSATASCSILPVERDAPMRGKRSESTRRARFVAVDHRVARIFFGRSLAEAKPRPSAAPVASRPAEIAAASGAGPSSVAFSEPTLGGVKLVPGETVLHFIGIGGIGMSAIAEILTRFGYKVRGSDAAEGANPKRLRELGCEVEVGQRAENITGDVAVVLEEARRRGLPVVHRADALAAVMQAGPARPRPLPLFEGAGLTGAGAQVCADPARGGAVAVGGTHGKTTTTSLMAALLEAAGAEPTVVNGGIINAYKSNAKVGRGEWVVVEADESDGTFTRLPASVCVVTNMDPEHMEHYLSFDNVRAAFGRFVRQALAAPNGRGLALLCSDHPEVARLADECSAAATGRVVTYGFKDGAEVRATNVRFTPDGEAFFDVTAPRARMAGLRLRAVGEHNVQNALSAVALALELGIPEAALRAALAGFEGVQRRFTLAGRVRGVTIIDDYGHHPVEIAAVLRAARAAVSAGAPGARVVAVHQPHRYTRLSDLFHEFAACFADADALLLSPVYPAGEAPIPVRPARLAPRPLGRALTRGRGRRTRRWRRRWRRRARGRGRGGAGGGDDRGPEELAGALDALELREGDLVVCLGAGSISAWARALPAQLSALWDVPPAQ
eukprot:tig00021795_g23524.t1